MYDIMLFRKSFFGSNWIQLPMKTSDDGIEAQSIQALRLIKGAEETTVMPNYSRPLKGLAAEMFTYEEFKRMVKMGAITPDDGSAYIATNQSYDPDSNAFKELPQDGEWVVWFNK